MKLIKIKTDHYIVVDDSEIKEGDWYVHNQKGVGLRVQQCVATNLPMDSKKITHSNQPLNTIILKNRNHSQSVGHYYGDGGQLSLQEVKELLGEVDVEKKAINSWEGCDGCDANDELFFINGYQKGYNQAIEDNKNNKYTEQDMRRYHNIMCLHGNKKGEEFIQSLQPKTEWEVEFDENGKLKLKQ